MAQRPPGLFPVAGASESDIGGDRGRCSTGRTPFVRLKCSPDPDDKPLGPPSGGGRLSWAGL